MINVEQNKYIIILIPPETGSFLVLSTTIKSTPALDYTIACVIQSQL